MGVTSGFGGAKKLFSGILTGDALRAKAMRGGAWLGTGSVAEQAARFARNMLLTRLLAPNAFGTMAIVLSSAAVVNTLTDVGERAAIIQSPKGDQPAYLNASWWLGFGRNLLSYVVIFAIAPWVGHFYARPELSGLLRLALVSVLFNGAMSPRCVLVQRQLKLGRWAAITNGGGFCGVVVTVILCFFMRNVWALAIGYCCEDASRFIISYIICPGWPRWRIDLKAVKELLMFSRGVFGMAPLNLIISRADIFVLGRLYSLSVLGVYAMGVALAVTPSVFITGMLGQTLLPTMSSIQEDTQRLNRILLEVTAWLAVLGVPTTLFVMLSAPSMLRLAYGLRYAAAAGPLSVAAAVVLLTVLNAPPTTVLFAKGLPGVHRQGIVVNAIIMLLAVYPASKLLGPTGAQIAALVGVTVGYLYQVVRLRIVTGLSLASYGSAFAAPLLASAAALGIVVGCHRLGFAANPTANILLCVASCLVAMAVCAAIHLHSMKRRKGSFSPKTPESAVAL